MLPIRKIHPQPLVDYIGRVETVSPPLIRSGKEIKKVKIKDLWEKIIEITFWDQTVFPYKKDEAFGKLLTVTATLATSAVLNPPIPNLQSSIERFNQLKQPNIQQSQLMFPIREILNKFNEDPTV
ncbi:hypothetical protein Lser_V15G33101 [Lactuca serriola]